MVTISKKFNELNQKEIEIKNSLTSYTIKNKLGEGAFGTVKLGLHNKTNERVYNKSKLGSN